MASGCAGFRSGPGIRLIFAVGDPCFLTAGLSESEGESSFRQGP